jgi:hypothetical protein
LIRSVSKAIWPSIEPVFVAFPPYSAKMLALFSVVIGILDINIAAAKVLKIIK